MSLEITLMILSAAIAEVCRRIDLHLEIVRKKRLFKDMEKIKKELYLKTTKDLYLKTKLHLHHNFIGIGFVFYSFLFSNFEAFWLGSGLLLHHLFTEGW